MKQFKLLVIFSGFFVISSNIILAQKVEFNAGVNIIAPSDILIFSPFGIRTGINLKFEQYILRTNLSLNYHTGFYKDDDFLELKNAFFTQLEEAILYQTKDNLKNIYFGAGLGYYSVLDNDNSAHASEISPGIWLNNHGFDSNFGLNIIVGKDFGTLILELKYIYTKFRLERYYYDENSGNGDKYLNFSFHALNLSLGF